MERGNKFENPSSNQGGHVLVAQYVSTQFKNELHIQDYHAKLDKLEGLTLHQH